MLFLISDFLLGPLGLARRECEARVVLPRMCHGEFERAGRRWLRGRGARFDCESGGIGRRARLRIWYRKGWGFGSPLSHQKALVFGLRSLAFDKRSRSLNNNQRPKTKNPRPYEQ